MLLSATTTARSRVMLVDDQKSNLKIAGNSLSDDQFIVSLHQGGAEMLKKVKDFEPDIIILDLHMPEMDGVELCERIKQIPECEDVPVLFLTSSRDCSDLARAFEAGAVDYIHKPFDQRELILRILTHVELRNSQKKLAARSKDLEELNEEMSEMLAIVSHDLKNPLGNLINGLELITPELASESRALSEVTGMLHLETDKMTKLIQSLLHAYEVDNHSLQPKFTDIDLYTFLSKVVSSHQGTAKEKQQEIILEKCENLPSLKSDPQLLQQVLDNLLSNAIKFSPKGERIEIRIQKGSSLLGFSITNHGVGLSEEDQEQLFKKFARLSTRPTGLESSNGLGLSIVKRLVEVLDGKISCRSEVGRQTTFSIIFKI